MANGLALMIFDDKATEVNTVAAGENTAIIAAWVATSVGSTSIIARGYTDGKAITVGACATCTDTLRFSNATGVVATATKRINALTCEPVTDAGARAFFTVAAAFGWGDTSAIFTNRTFFALRFGLALTVDNRIIATFANTTNTNAVTANSVVGTDNHTRVRRGILVDGRADWSGLWAASDGSSEREKGEGK